MKRNKTGFTVVELLTVITILALLVGILLPAVTAVKTAAKETKQRAQLTTIGMGLTAFKNDFGDYPPSDINDNYCGSQKLAEALVTAVRKHLPRPLWAGICWDLTGIQTGMQPIGHIILRTLPYCRVV